MKTVVFTDFDGTISKRDIGYSMFHHFSGGKNDELLPDWKSGVITSREVLTREAEMVDATEQEIRDFIDTIDIDQYFPEFVDICRQNDIPIQVVSDGLDFYIKHLLQKNKLGDLKVYSNKAVFDGRKLRIEFPIENKNCLRCGICKGELIENYRAASKEDVRVIFIGDGYSDTCAALKTDILFAKKDLQKYCVEEKIYYNSYNTFDDVINKLRELQIFK